MLNKLWNDESGIVTLEYLILATVLGTASIAGLHQFSQSMNAEMAETGNAVLSLNQGYAVSGTSGCSVSVDGSQATDTPASLTAAIPTPPSTPSAINVIPCP